MKEREEKVAQELKKQQEKEAKKKEAADKAAALEAQKRVPPSELFRLAVMWIRILCRS